MPYWVSEIKYDDIYDPTFGAGGDRSYSLREVKLMNYKFEVLQCRIACALKVHAERYMRYWYGSTVWATGEPLEDAIARCTLWALGLGEQRPWAFGDMPSLFRNREERAYRDLLRCVEEDPRKWQPESLGILRQWCEEQEPVLLRFCPPIGTQIERC